MERSLEARRTRRSGEAILVTGASTGIGAAIARDLVRRGFHVFGTVRRAVDRARLRRAGVVPLMMDVTDMESVVQTRSAVAAALDGRRLRGLVNNAGIAAAGPLELVPLAELRHVLEVNVVGVVAVTQAFLPLLRGAHGRVVNISSISGRLALPLVGPYAASKFALEGLSDSLRRELALFGVKVVVIQPGTVRTPIWDKLAALGRDRFRGSIYERSLDRVWQLALAGASRGLPPDAVAGAVAKALLAKRPPARIVVRRGSPSLGGLLTLLPDQWLDQLIARRIGG